MTFAATCEESNAVFLIVLVLITLKAFCNLLVNVCIIEVVIGHLASHVNTLLLWSATIIDQRVQILISLKPSHILLSMFWEFPNAFDGSIEAGSAYLKLCLIGRSFCLRIEFRILGKGKNLREVDSVISTNICLRVKNEFKHDTIVREETSNLQQCKIWVTRTIVK